MSQDNRAPQPTALDYAKPTRRRGNPVLGVTVGTLGVCAGLFGTLMLFQAILGAVYVFTRSNSRDLAGDFFALMLFLLIGIVCLYVAIRWCRAACGIVAGR
jgi:hypothetical protein